VLIGSMFVLASCSGAHDAVRVGVAKIVVREGIVQSGGERPQQVVISSTGGAPRTAPRLAEVRSRVALPLSRPLDQAGINCEAGTWVTVTLTDGSARRYGPCALPRWASGLAATVWSRAYPPGPPACSFAQHLTGDVTGDGRPDLVILTETGNDEFGCHAVLTVENAAGTTITSLLHMPDSPAGLVGFTPSLIGLGHIDTRPGLEMLTVLTCGTACTPSIWTVAKGRILPEPFFGGRNGVSLGGGTASSASSVDCTGRPGWLASSSAGVVDWTKARWRLAGERDVYRAVGTRLVYQPTASVRRSIQIAAFSNYTWPVPVPRVPFAHCLVVRGHIPL
jgi:hypothetical protein